MRTRLLAAVSAVILSLGISTSASALPLLFDFTPSGSGTVNLGTSEVYTVAGISVTAYAGSYSGMTVTRATTSGANAGILVGNNRGVDEQGLGVCLSSSSNGCNPSHYNDNPEIDAGRELIQLDITNLLAAGYTNLFVNADSATSGETLKINGSSTSAGLGILLATITSAQGNVAISQNGSFLNFISDSSTGHDVMLHALLADRPSPVPEPASLALIGLGLAGIGLAKRQQRI